MAGLPAPLLPLQILWLNLLTDTVPALALAVEPAESGIMCRHRNPQEAILSGRVARSTVGYALLISLATLIAFGVGLTRPPENAAYATTLAFMTLAFAQIFHLGNARSALPVLRPDRVVSNPYAPLAREDWLIIGGLSLVPAAAGQSVKLVAAVRRPFLSARLP